ncbi:MAG: carboxypeptidase regulatory-like domain-containing protein [Deltaproteobacteria bacterium]|nr:carboxypeptidase regulatory-like domain-containing protein [Deltaproteobacteria bacterium]
MKKQSVLSAVFLFVLFGACEAFAADTYGGQNNQAQTTGTSSNTAILFYGKVIDQNGRPVAGAKITAGREFFSTNSVRFIGVETVQAEADDDGNFVLTGLLVKRLYIRSIEKRCYEAPRTVYETSYSYDEGSKDPVFIPDPGKPVVFTLEKKCDPGIVDSKKRRMLMRPSSEGFTVDLFKGFSEPLIKIPKDEPAPDIQVFIDQVPGEVSCHMLVSAPGRNNGLAEKEGQPHSAPGSGYVPSFLYTIDKNREAKAVLYHKGRGGKVYSRLEISLAPASNGIMVTAELFTNIAGSRNTDFDSVYTEEEVCRLTGGRFNYGGPSYRRAVAGILEETIR